MRFVIALLALLCTTSAQCDVSIALNESFSEKYAALKHVSPEDSAKAAQLHKDFQELLTVARIDDVRLVVVNNALGFAFPERVIAVHEEFGGLPKAKRMFILAHELGHIANRDFDKLFSLASSIDRKLSFAAPHETAKVGAQETARFSRVSHSNEFGADQYASRMLARLNLDVVEGALVLEFAKDEPEQLSHPAPMERLRRLKAVKD